MHSLRTFRPPGFGWGSLGLGLASFALAGSLSAATSTTWDGGQSHGNFTVNNLWSTANNWVGVDGVPVSGATTDVTFAFSTTHTTSSQNLGAGFTLRTLAFAAGANVTALTGNALSFATDGRIVQDSGTPVRIAQGLNFTANTILTGSGTGRITLEGPLSGSLLRIFGSVGSQTPLLVTLGNANTLNGLTIGTGLVGVGPVDVTLVDNASGGLGTVTFISGNTLRASGNRTLPNPLTFLGQSNGLPFDFIIGAGGDLLLTGAVNFGGGSKTLQVDNALTTISGAVSGNGPVFKIGAGTLSLAGLDNTPFTGSWYIEEGKVLLKEANAGVSAQFVPLVDGGLDLNGQPQVSIGALSGVGALALGSTSLTIGNKAIQGAPYRGAITSSSPGVGLVRAVGADHELLLEGSTSSFGTLFAESGRVRLVGAQLSLVTARVGSAGTIPATLVLEGGSVLALAAPSSTLSLVGPAGTRTTVTGAGSRLTVGHELLICGSGVAEALLTVSDGGFASAFFMEVGSANSTGGGALEILNGGRVESDGGILGFSDGCPGRARLSGTGSTWTNQSLGLGGYSSVLRGGVGTLLIEDDADVVVTGATTLWTRGSRIDIAGGRLTTGSIAAEDTNVVLAVSDPDEFTSGFTVGTNDASSVFNGPITNSFTAPGGLTKVSLGQLILTGPLTYTGRTRLQGGSMTVPNSNLFATLLDLDAGTIFTFNGVWGSNGVSQTTIAAGAQLTGNGTLRGAVNNAGLIAISGSQSLMLSGPVQNSGRIRVANGASFSAAQSLANSGVLDLISAGAVNLPANFTNTGRVLDRHSLRPTVTAADGKVVVNASGFAGHTYRLQRSSSVASDTGSFANLGAPQTLTSDGPLVFVDQTPPAGSAFYRIKVD